MKPGVAGSKRDAVGFLATLVVGLGALAGVAYAALTHTARAWFERDVALRARVLASSARPFLVRQMRRGNAGELHRHLQEITRDERIMAAAACGADGGDVAHTEAFDAAGFGCRAALDRLGEAGVRAAGWMRVSELAAGPVHVAVFPLDDAAGELGALVLVHDMNFAARREAAARNVLLAVFAGLAAGASALTLVAQRLAWRGWTKALRHALLAREDHPEFRPLLRDVRELVHDLASERDREAREGRWTAARLKSVLGEHLEGERVVIVANREPYIHERAAGGGVEVRHPASGLVTALEPVMRACSGVWVAHGSGTADRETSDARGRVKVPPGEESYVIRRVWLGEDEEQGYYYGLANEGLWPLCHVAHVRPVFRASDWEHYRAVNRRFADAVCEEVDSDDPIVLVQDYHFALAPRMIRERLPRATILTFWHIPWPGAERIAICPWRDELLEGMLGSSILGFHTRQHCNNFLESVDAFLEARIDRERNAVVQAGRATLVNPYPISIEWPVRWLDGAPAVQRCRAEVFRELGLADDAALGVGVDRLDYTKGIEERLLAVERAIESFPALRGRFTFVQLAAPSRTRIARYRDLNDAVEEIARRINARWATASWRPVILLRAHHEPPEVFRFYRAADVCYVSSLHDGMNLVAKEFVAARDDERGVLVLSQFTGAARELTEALVVNPYDLEQASAALAAAVRMSPAEQGARMRAMRSLVREFNVYRWAGKMLVDAASLRRRERLTGLFSGDAP